MLRSRLLNQSYLPLQVFLNYGRLQMHGSAEIVQDMRPGNGVLVVINGIVRVAIEDPDGTPHDYFLGSGKLQASCVNRCTGGDVMPFCCWCQTGLLVIARQLADIVLVLGPGQPLGFVALLVGSLQCGRDGGAEVSMQSCPLPPCSFDQPRVSFFSLQTAALSCCRAPSSSISTTILTFLDACHPLTSAGCVHTAAACCGDPDVCHLASAGGAYGLYVALTGETLPGGGTAIAEGNALGKGPVVFHFSQAGIQFIRDRAAGGKCVA